MPPRMSPPGAKLGKKLATQYKDIKSEWPEPITYYDGIARWLTDPNMNWFRNQGARLKRQPGWLIHDLFNLILGLPVISVATVYSLLYDVHLPLQVSFMGYILIDCLWILLQPAIVKSPALLVGHHMFGAMLCGHTLLYPPHARYAAWMTVVEINTELLILRRHFKNLFTEILFHMSWFGIRVFWYPYLPFHWWYLKWPPGPWFQMCRIWISASTLVLVVMQLQWTYNLVLGLVKKPAPPQEETETKGDKPKFL